MSQQTGQTALMLAAAHNKVVFSHLLIQAGADINLQDKVNNKLCGKILYEIAIKCIIERNIIMESISNE